jgi:hypothetical protein
MILVPLAAASIDRLWPVIAPFAERMAAEMPDDWPPPELRRRAAAGILTLWAVWSPEENAIVAISGTEIQHRPSGRTALVVAMTAQYQAALGRTNVDAANIENRIGAARSIGQSQGDFLGTQLSAAGGYTNAQSADIGNIFGASSTLADIYAGGMNRALSAANAIPGLGQAQYAPATWLAQVGAARESDRAAELADLVARYNYQQQAPMEMLNWLKAISGDGGVYSPTFAELPGVTQSPWFSVLG